MRYRILPYKQGSRSAKALSEALGGKVLKLQNSKYTPKNGDVIINWGKSGTFPLNLYSPVDVLESILNHPTPVSFVANKLNFFNMMSVDNSDIIPEFWTNKEDITDDKFPIVCRTILNGHSGAGIVIADCRDDLVEAPLYVRYVKKKDEYRVHVGRVSEYMPGMPAVGETIISVQRKARREGHENPNWQVRNHANGFNFVRGGVNPPESVLSVAKSALKASGLDFGAVDVGWNETTGKATVYEINTAPGLEGQTVADYVKFFKGEL